VERHTVILSTPTHCCCCPSARSHPRHRVHAHGRFASPITARPRRTAAPRPALPLRRSRAARSSCRERQMAACPSCGSSRGRRFRRCELAPRPTRAPRRPFHLRLTSTLHSLAAAIHMGRAQTAFPSSFRSASSLVLARERERCRAACGCCRRRCTCCACCLGGATSVRSASGCGMWVRVMHDSSLSSCTGRD